MNMELLQLKYFCHAAVSQNFSHTAQEFMVPPSCISASVKRLEQELGTKLFDRSANRAVLNENGRKFFQSASLALQLLGNAANEIKHRQPPKEISLLVRCNRRLVAACMEEFRGKDKSVFFSLTHKTERSYFDFDMVISDEPLDGAYKQTLLYKEPVLLAMEANHPLAQKSEIHPTDLENEKFVAMEKGSSMRRVTEQLCLQAGFSPKVVTESDDPYYIRRYIGMGLGVGFVPTVAWEGLFPPNMVTKPVRGLEYERKTYLIFPKPLTQEHHTAFAELMTERFRNC